jgi:T-complex protein 1 subunit delta
LVDLSAAQDVEAGDGTTTVTIVAGALLAAVQKLMNVGIHPSVISEAFMKAALKAEQILEGVSIPVDFKNRETLLASSNTSLNSKVVGQYSNILSPIAVDAVMKVVDTTKDKDVDLNNVKVVKKLGGTIEDTRLIDGLVFAQKSEHGAGGGSRVENAKIGLIQFCLSPPKTNVSFFFLSGHNLEVFVICFRRFTNNKNRWKVM